MIPVSEYTYHLPDDRIAKFPLAERDQSRLLLYRKGTVSHHAFRDIPELLPAESILFFNDTKVIPARMHFAKDTGAVIEIFLLNPADPGIPVHHAMLAKGQSIWKCVIGNIKRWNDGLILSKNTGSLNLRVTLVNREENLVKFEWAPEENTFAEVIHVIGATPLPPYLKRDALPSDEERYQTVYSHLEGAVAAPTAGLHFTNKVLDEVRRRGLATDFLTLHVSAGTFQPVKTENAVEHKMHQEQVIVSKKNVENMLSTRTIVAVGTTAMRTMESLYWYGVKLRSDKFAAFEIEQDAPYSTSVSLPAKEESLRAVLEHMNERNLTTLVGYTSIYILPGYRFRICEGLITNFHQPGSTLMLLVAAFVGPDWKRIYHEAMNNDYRFLSFGDSSLLLPDKAPEADQPIRL